MISGCGKESRDLLVPLHCLPLHIHAKEEYRLSLPSSSEGKKVEHYRTRDKASRATVPGY